MAPLSWTVLARMAAASLAALIGAATLGGQSPASPTPPAQQPPGTGLIVGQVVDAESGRPVGESIVTLMGNAGQAVNPAAALAAARKVITDSNGRFVYRELAKGQYSLTVMKPGYVAGNYGKFVPRGPGAALDLADAEKVTDVRILVWKHAAIAGRVVDEAGEPVVAAEIRVQRVTTVAGRPGFQQVMTSGTVTTDDRGVYRVPALDPGGYVVGVAATSTTIPAAMVEEYFRATGTARAEMQQALFAAAPTMSSPGSAANQVIGDHILQVQGRMPTPPAPAADGTQAVYTAVFYPQATRMADATVITLQGGETRAGVDMQLRAVPSARVSGRLEGPDGPVGIAALYLMPMRGGDPDGLTADATATTVTDASGAFTFLGVPAGQYTLFAFKQPVSTSQVTQMTVVQGPGGTSARGMVGEGGDDTNAKPAYWAQQVLAAGESNIANVRVVTHVGLRVSGKVIFEGGSQPPPMNRLIPFLEPTAYWLRALPLGETTIGAGGSFTLPGVPAGRYFLTIPVPAGWFVKTAVAKGQDLVELPFQLTDDITDAVVTFSDRGARVSGTVLDRDSRADSSAGVMVFPADSRQWVDLSSYSRRIRNTRTGRDGTFTLVDLPAGDYYIVAAPQASMDWAVAGLLQRLSQAATRFTLAEGEKKTMDLTHGAGAMTMRTTGRRLRIVVVALALAPLFALASRQNPPPPPRDVPVARARRDRDHLGSGRDR